MGFGNFFFRGRGNQKLVNPPDTIEDIVSKKTIESNSYEMYKLINQLRDLSQTREYKYAEYDVMSADVIIRTALNMYADDATQVDENSKTILSVDSKDEILQKDLYSFLRKIKMEEKLRDVAYALGKYGNKYWKLYLTKDRKDIDHIEEIDDPGTVLDLWYQGEPAYFAENPDDTHLYKNTDEFDLYSHDSFIHFYAHSGDESDVIELMDNQELDSKGDPKILKYKVVEGESLIEAVRAIWRILRSLEDSLLAARLAKADYVRIFNIEVGDSSSTDTRLIVNKVKKVFDSAVSMDVRNGTYTATKQQRAIGDPIFNSVSNGQGSISIESVGGDIEVKSLVDIDYFNNQLFAGLRIPKQLMGFCLRGDTKIMLMDGTNPTIKEMAENADYYVGRGILSCAPDGTIEPTLIKGVRKTRENAEFVRVTLDNGEHVDTTPDHKFMMRDGSFKSASELLPNDSLMPCYSGYSNGRKWIMDNRDPRCVDWMWQYRLSAKYLLNEGQDVPKGYQVHHKNRIKCNDDPSNLQIMTIAEHCKEHSIELHEAYGRKGYKHPEEVRAKISRNTSIALKGKPKSPEHCEKIRQMAKTNYNSHFKTGENNVLNSNSTAYENHHDARKKYSTENPDIVKLNFLKQCTCESCNNVFYKYGTSKQVLCDDCFFEEYGYLPKNKNREVCHELAEKYKSTHNHKVVSVEKLSILEDAYDLEVESSNHTFVLSSGIFVHNCDDLNGWSADKTMVQLDIRYGKHIKKVIDSLVQGITDLCDIWLKLHDRENQIGKYKIVYNSPSTTEELARIKELMERVEVVAQLTDTLVGASTGINKIELLWKLLNQFVPYQVFLDQIRPVMENAVDDAKLDIEIAKKMKENQLKQLEEQPDQSTPPPSFEDFGMADPDAYVDSMNLGNDAIPFNPLGSDPMTGNPEVPNAGNSRADDAALNQILKSME